jgi:hypothetical protein
MRNAKEEFLGHIGNRKVLCAYINYQDCWSQEIPTKLNQLSVGYTEQEFTDFVDYLDFEYDAGYGGQEVFGTIWYADGTWSNRGEYDGSEWWEHHQCPQIPNSLSK